MTEMLKTCLSPTDGTRTNMLPSGYETSRHVISCGFPGQKLTLFEGFERGAWMRWRCAGVDHPLGLKADSHLDLVYGGTERICERSEKTVHGEGHQMMVDARLRACHHLGVGNRQTDANTHGRWLRQIPGASQKAPSTPSHVRPNVFF